MISSNPQACRAFTAPAPMWWKPPPICCACSATICRQQGKRWSEQTPHHPLGAADTRVAPDILCGGEHGGGASGFAPRRPHRLRRPALVRERAMAHSAGADASLGMGDQTLVGGGEVSFSEPTELTGWRKAIVAGLFVLAILMLPLGFLAWSFGSCPAFASPACEPPSAFRQLLLFPGVSLVLFASAFWLRRYFKRLCEGQR
ncbi:hypothetical protein ERY430_41345 [Erythrobacter sp. EC-HK427]|nr:hypothetical protein ERY430_41345 [Erythrobacter sp. EC-HK427]